MSVCACVRVCVCVHVYPPFASPVNAVFLGEGLTMLVNGVVGEVHEGLMQVVQ